MEKLIATATWRVEANINCPHCDDYFDVIGELTDSFEKLPNPYESADVDELITCPNCKEEFIIKDIEY